MKKKQLLNLQRERKGKEKSVVNSNIYILKLHLKKNNDFIDFCWRRLFKGIRCVCTKTVLFNIGKQTQELGRLS